MGKYLLSIQNFYTKEFEVPLEGQRREFTTGAAKSKDIYGLLYQ